MNQFVPSDRILQFKNKPTKIKAPSIAGEYKMYIIDFNNNISPPSSFDIMVVGVSVKNVQTSWGDTLTGKVVKDNGWIKIITQFVFIGTANI